MRYCKRPVTIEARQFTNNNQDGDAQMNELVAWINADKAPFEDMASHDGTDIKIPTLEGTMKASFGDWIICGVKGEFYPCKPDVFAASYTVVMPRVACKLLTGHIVNPCNDRLSIAVEDRPGAGGAHHRYVIRGADYSRNASADDFAPAELQVIFQNGPILEHGTNGVTHEALLAIVIDRLECFQAGPFANPYNAQALNHLREAQTSLQARTRERMARGVEGTHNK